MVTNVTSLLKTVKAVEDEATKGTRALEATTEHIRQELAVSAGRRLWSGAGGPARPPHSGPASSAPAPPALTLRLLPAARTLTLGLLPAARLLRVLR